MSLDTNFNSLTLAGFNHLKKLIFSDKKQAGIGFRSFGFFIFKNKNKAEDFI